jgi:hypothetical protein
MRFGIEMSTDHTLEEVGKQFDVTRERIRQIEAKAIRKLKHPSRSDNCARIWTTCNPRHSGWRQGLLREAFFLGLAATASGQKPPRISRLNCPA